MCRLLGWVAQEPRTLVDLIGDRGVAALTGLSQHHVDGWGLAWLDNDGLHSMRSVLPAHADPSFATAAANVRADAAVLHFRWATPGLPVRVANTHPFCHDGAAFVHNGRILPFAALARHVPAAARETLEGDTDSECYFRILLAQVRAKGAVEGVRQTIAEIGVELTPSSLNALLLTDESLIAVSCYDPASSPTVGGLATVMLEDEEPPEPLPGHFELRYRATPDAVVVASSGWPQEGWQLLPNGAVLQVPRRRPRPRVDLVGTLPDAALQRAAAARVAAVAGRPPLAQGAGSRRT